MVKKGKSNEREWVTRLDEIERREKGKRKALREARVAGEKG